MASFIPPNFTSELLLHTDVVSVISKSITLKKAGKNFTACCPFHDEKTPSFSVSQDKQIYYCFGCGAYGNAISFMMDYSGMGFVEAVEELASLAGLKIPQSENNVRKIKGSNELYDLMESLVQHFCRQLHTAPPSHHALKYLEQRSLSDEIKKEFELGFALPGFDNLLKTVGISEQSRERLAQVGMLVDKESGGHYDRFRDRIMFPIRDQRGRAVGFGGRIIGDEEPKYLNSPETTIFKKRHELYGLFQARHKLKNMQHIYLVEGYMDVLALVQHGIHNVVAALGTAVSEEHLQKLYRHCKQIIFCFDGDIAGKKAAWRTMETALPLLKEGRQVYFMFMPDGDDPDTYVQKYGREKFEDVLNWIPLSDYLLNQFKQNADLGSREGISRLIDDISPLVAKLPDCALRELLIKDIAHLSNMNIDALKRLIEQQKPAPTKTSLRHTTTKKSSKWTTNLVTEAVIALLHDPKLAMTVEANILDDIELQGINFLRELIALVHQQPQISCAGILEYWRNTKYEKRLQELSIEDNLLSELNNLQEMFAEIIKKIKQNYEQKLRTQDLEYIRTTEDLCKLFPANGIDKKDS